MEIPQHQRQTPGVQEHTSDLVAGARLSVWAHMGSGKVGEVGECSQSLEGVLDTRILHTVRAVRHIAGLEEVVAAVVVVAMSRFQAMEAGIDLGLGEEHTELVGVEVGELQLIALGDNLFQQ